MRKISMDPEKLTVTFGDEEIDIATLSGMTMKTSNARRRLTPREFAVEVVSILMGYDDSYWDETAILGTTDGLVAAIEGYGLAKHIRRSDFIFALDAAVGLYEGGSEAILRIVDLALETLDVVGNVQKQILQRQAEEKERLEREKPKSPIWGMF